jgi:hypothetical protein
MAELFIELDSMSCMPVPESLPPSPKELADFFIPDRHTQKTAERLSNIALLLSNNGLENIGVSAQTGFLNPVSSLNFHLQDQEIDLPITSADIPYPLGGTSYIANVLKNPSGNRLASALYPLTQSIGFTYEDSKNRSLLDVTNFARVLQQMQELFMVRVPAEFFSERYYGFWGKLKENLNRQIPNYILAVEPDSSFSWFEYLTLIENLRLEGVSAGVSFDAGGASTVYRNSTGLYRDNPNASASAALDNVLTNMNAIPIFAYELSPHGLTDTKHVLFDQNVLNHYELVEKWVRAANEDLYRIIWEGNPLEYNNWVMGSDFTAMFVTLNSLVKSI